MIRTEGRQSLGRILPEFGVGAAIAADDHRAEGGILFEAQQEFPALELLLHQNAGGSILGSGGQQRLQPGKAGQQSGFIPEVQDHPALVGFMNIVGRNNL